MLGRYPVTWTIALVGTPSAAPTRAACWPTKAVGFFVRKRRLAALK